LDDLGINDDNIQREDVFDCFQITPEIINKSHKQGLFEALTNTIQKQRGITYVIGKADAAKYTEVIRKVIDSRRDKNLLKALHL